MEERYDFEKLLKRSEKCACGKVHKSLLKKVMLKPGAIKELAAFISSIGDFSTAVMVCDENTYKAAGILAEKNYDFAKTIILNPENLHANEESVAEVESALPKGCDLLLAVGSGTIHDITRYIGNKKNIPFISVPTAPSVDGFVSVVAAMTWNSVKKTFPAVSPIAMLADSEVLAKAPYRLIAAGVGDLLGKYTAISDWKIGNILTGEYICDYIIKLEEDAVADVRKDARGIVNCEIPAIEKLMYGLLLSGLAIQFSGNSRPASGSEHHISHFIEMCIINEKDTAYHGEKVGVGLALLCDKYRKIAKELTKDSVIDSYKGLDTESIKSVYGRRADEIIAENTPDPLSEVSLKTLSEKAEEVRAVLMELPDGNEIREILKVYGAPSKLSDIGISDDKFEEIWKYSTYVRRRLTFMRVAQLLK